MASLIGKRSAQVALRALRDAQGNTVATQNRLASGLKVASSSDNPAYFLVASETRGDIAVNRGIRENLTSIDSALTVAFTGIGAIRGSLDNIRSAIIAGESAGYDNGLDRVIREQIEMIRDTITATTSADQNFLSAGGDETVITAITQSSNSGLDVQTLLVRSLELDRREASPTEGVEIIPASEVFDLSGGGSVVRFGNRYKVTSLATGNVARDNASFNAYRDGPADADPAARIVHPTGPAKQWLLSASSDDFRTRSGTGNSVFAGDGNDRLNSGTNNSVLVGGAGDDLIQGTRNGDRIWGDDGDDFLRVTRAGNIAVGGSGDDDLRGGGSAEVFYGGVGNDDIRTSGGADIIVGGSGDDDIRSGNGNDLIYEGLNSGSDDIRLGGGGGTVFYEGDASRYTINVINGTRFTVTDNVTGDVDDIRNGTPADLVFNTAPPAEPDRPVPANFLDAFNIDYATLTDPTSGEAVRNSLSFMALVEFLDPETPGYDTVGALQVLETALQKLNFGEAQLGSIQTRIRRSMESSRSLTDSLEQGVSALVETAYDEESARLASAQVQEALAVESLGISNQRAQIVLNLFQ